MTGTVSPQADLHPPSPVLAAKAWPTNAHLIADVAKLGYLGDDWATLDPTYGRGVWWKKFRPVGLVGCDLDVSKSPVGWSVDFRDLPFGDGSFRAVVFDPPYKLNGTSSLVGDERYGVHTRVSTSDRLGVIAGGLDECVRVLERSGFLLVKCQDQVVSGRVCWQTDLVTRHLEALGMAKVDAFHMLGHRPQPPGRRQLHARRNHSTLLVLRKTR